VDERGTIVYHRKSYRKVLGLLKGKYEGFGPTLACEKLVEVEGLQISKERPHQLMIAEGLWKPRQACKAVVHQLKARRTCYGELVQIDGSPHDWFEGRTPTCSLLVFIDDATSKLGQLSFVKSESFFRYSMAAEPILSGMASHSSPSTAINPAFPGSISLPAA